MLFVSLGASDAIGASCHFLKINETGLILDAGSDPEQDGPDGLPAFDLIHQNPDWYVDHVCITHAHHDHLGALPVLIREFPHVMVHMTRATRDLAELLLPASARLQRRKLREGSTTHEPLFGEEELEVYSYLYLTHEYEEAFSVKGIRDREARVLEAAFFNAGHVLGSAGVMIEFEEDDETRTLFYTSDTNLRSQTILPGGAYPDPPIDILVLESTLGADPDAELTTRRSEEIRFAETLKTVLDRGGVALVPVFALGRAQEVLALVDRYKQRGLIPEETPVFTAGSMRAIADVYDKTRFHTPRLNEEFEVFGVDQKRLPRRGKARKNALTGPSIHILSSGMMFERTPSNELAQSIIEDEKNAVLLVGFAREDSPADRLLQAAAEGPGTEAVLSDWVGPQPVHCTVDRFRFSGHSHRRDLLQLVERLQPKKVVLVHGEPDARMWLADNIQYFHPETEVLRPDFGEVLEL